MNNYDPYRSHVSLSGFLHQRRNETKEEYYEKIEHVLREAKNHGWETSTGLSYGTPTAFFKKGDRCVERSMSHLGDDGPGHGSLAGFGNGPSTVATIGIAFISIMVGFCIALLITLVIVFCWAHLTGRTSGQ